MVDLRSTAPSLVLLLRSATFTDVLVQNPEPLPTVLAHHTVTTVIHASTTHRTPFLLLLVHPSSTGVTILNSLFSHPQTLLGISRNDIFQAEAGIGTSRKSMEHAHEVAVSYIGSHLSKCLQRQPPVKHFNTASRIFGPRTVNLIAVWDFRWNWWQRGHATVYTLEMSCKYMGQREFSLGQPMLWR